MRHGNAFKDLTGKRFGKLVVIEEAEKNPRGLIQWRCVCDCGNEKIALADKLQQGKTRSCGCLRSESKTRHGMSHTKIHDEWLGMKHRCGITYPESRYYADRGITVCNEWTGKHGFENFRDWAMENGFSEDLTIDRIDNNKGYSPENCRWANKTVQANNRRNVKLYDFRGRKLSVSQSAREVGIPYGTVRKRLKSGKTLEGAIGK